MTTEIIVNEILPGERDPVVLWAHIRALTATVSTLSTKLMQAEDREFQMRRQRDNARQDADDRIAGALA
jgi:hypothetical protein